jgi:hypothetical protein
MEHTDDIGSWLEDIAIEAKAYADSQKDYYLLVARERTARIAGGVLIRGLMLLFIAMVVLLLTIAGALAIGALLGSTVHGFLVMAGVYALTAGLIWIAWRSGLRERFIVTFVNTVHGHA